ncbi:MAG: hypothetical protein WC458_00450 [Patescibacteria group bacterium]|jgi:hypothetical protein
MKPEQSQFIPKRSKQETAQTMEASDTATKSGSYSWEKIPPMVRVVLQVMLAFSLALVVYVASFKLLPSSMNCFVRNLIGLVISLLILGGASSIQKTESKIGAAVLIFLSLFFVYNISRHYFVPGKQDNSSGQNSVSLANAPCRILLPGKYAYQLKPGQETAWLSVPDNGHFNYHISSPTYNYKIIFSDGTEYDGGQNVVIPEKSHVYFKIRANIDDLITVAVTN